VATHEGNQVTLLLLVGPLAKQHQPDHVQKRRADQVVNVDTAIAQQARFSLHIGYGGLAYHYPGEVR
jgi:hypothetical protein